MFYSIFPKVRVWLSEAEQDQVDTQKIIDEQISKSPRLSSINFPNKFIIK